MDLSTCTRHRVAMLEKIEFESAPSQAMLLTSKTITNRKKQSNNWSCIHATLQFFYFLKSCIHATLQTEELHVCNSSENKIFEELHVCNSTAVFGTLC